MNSISIIYKFFILSLISFNIINSGIGREEELVIKKYIKEGDIIFDVGANIGDWSSYVLQQHPKIEKMCLFEPTQSLIPALTSKFANYPVEIYELAVSFNEEPRLFEYYATCPGGSGFYHRPIVVQIAKASPEIIRLAPTSLDKFCQKQSIKHINFLKIDTEGGELDVLRGALNLLTNKSIDIIQFEYGGTYPDAKITLKEVYTLLDSCDYKIYKATEKGLVIISEWLSSLEDFKYQVYVAIAN